MIKKLIISWALVCSSMAFADTASFKQQFFYVGLMSGVANVDWSSTVSTDVSSYGSNPLSADGVGALFGADVGYQFSPHFAVEGEVIRMPDTRLTFYYILPFPPFNNDYLNQSVVTSHMTFAAVTFKVIAPLPNSKFSLFVDAGPAYQYRADAIKNIGTWAPTFGGGLLYRINEHWQAEGSFQYAPGTGKSIADPMYAYVPEIYAGTFKLDYIF